LTNKTSSLIFTAITPNQQGGKDEDLINYRYHRHSLGHYLESCQKEKANAVKF